MTAPFGTYDFETWDWVNPFVYCVYTPEQHTKGVLREGEKSPFNAPGWTLRYMRALALEGVKVFYAHNGGKFDVLFIVAEIQKMPGWKCDGITASGRVIALHVTADDGTTFDLKDSYAIIQSGLAKALESFEIPYRKTFTADDYAGDMRSLSDGALLEGCLADCEALYRLIERAQSMAEGWGGQLKATFSSTALSLVKAHLAPKELPSHEGQQWANEICSKADRGGRVEVYKHAPERIMRYYDISSSYPHSMTKALPWRLLGYSQAPELFKAGVMSVVYASVRVPEMYLPPLPFVPPSGGVFFPTGRWSAWFTSIELEYAMAMCGVKAEVHEAVEYTVETPFKSFIDTVYETKRTSTGAKREFAKLAMNGLGGKFGQKPENTKLKVFSTPEAAKAWAFYCSGECSPYSTDGSILEVSTFRWPKHTHYALAAFIKAYSRIHLHELSLKCQHLAYVDTDSLQCVASKYLDGEVGGALGDLKIELDEMHGHYFAPKLYRYMDVKTGEWTYKSKGFPVNADSFARIIKGEAVGNTKGRMQLFRAQLRKGNTEVRHLTEEETEKAWNGRSAKRRILPCAEGDTLPWTADDLVEGRHLEQRSPFAKNWPK